jgi:hypothetical protein
VWLVVGWCVVSVEAVRRLLAELLNAAEKTSRWCVDMEWQFYREAWEAERALEAAVPTAWLVKGGVAFAVVRFLRVAEPGEWWAERAWVAVPWIFGNGLFGVEVVFEDARFMAVACPHYGEGLAEMEKLHVLLNTEPVVGFRLHDKAVWWLRGWAMALQKEAVKKKAVEKARRVKHCQDL